MNDFLANNRPVILVVDDTPANIQILVEVLREEYEVMVATRGVQALKLAAGEIQPDLILLDMMMPEMDGHEVCRRLKNDDRTRDIPVIFITADTSARTEEKSFELGAVDYVVKPFSIPVVRARVRTHVTLKHRNDMLARMAQLDGLTGIANRRRFDEMLAAEWQRCSRRNLPLSVILADVDHFKLFNDTYGHGAGDKVLIALAQILTGVASRPDDLPARYGGEEFVILLPSTPFEGAEQIAERLRERVASSRVSTSPDSTRRKVTLSVGFSTIIPLAAGNPAELVKAADEMMYRAKNEGRNRVAGRLLN